jgi:hypothetical protein
MKRTMFNLLPAIFLWLGSCCVANGQVAQSDEIADDSQQIIQDDISTTGKFEPVTVEPSTSSDVKLQFPVSSASKSVSIAALDGGTVTSAVSPTIGTDGSLSFWFQVSDQPGVHRVIVIDPNADPDSPHIIGVVQFEVPTPAE